MGMTSLTCHLLLHLACILINEVHDSHLRLRKNAFMIRKNISPSNNNRQTPQQAPIGPRMIQVTPVHPNTLRPRYTLTIQTLRSTRAPWPVRKSASASFRKKHKRRHFGRFVCFFGFQSTGKTRRGWQT